MEPPGNPGRFTKRQLFIVDELPPANATTPEFVAQIQAREQSFALAVAVIASYRGPAGKAANVQTAESEFAIFAREGLRPQGQGSSVRDGCVRVMDLLADETQPLVVAKRCTGLIRALSQVKPHRSQHEIHDTDHEIFSHPLDALRYLMVNLPQPAGDWKPPAPFSWDRHQRIW